MTRGKKSCLRYQPPGAVDREFFIGLSDVFDVVDPGPFKNASKKILLRSFWRYFRAEICHGDPILASDILGKMANQKSACFAKINPYASPGQSARTNMSALGFSNYEMFTKK